MNEQELYEYTEKRNEKLINDIRKLQKDNIEYKRNLLLAYSLIILLVLFFSLIIAALL